MARHLLPYDDIPVSLLGSPGAQALFRRRRSVVVDPWAIFAFLAAAVLMLLTIGWLRRLIWDL